MAVLCGGIAALVVTIMGIDPADADIRFDWLTARAAISSDAYLGILDLADEFGVEISVHTPDGVSDPGAHPRTPGAILVTLPLVLFRFEHLFAVSTFFVVAGLVFLLYPVFSAASRVDRALLIVLAAASAPVFVTIRFAGQAVLVAVLALLGWSRAAGKGTTVGAACIAVAGVLKVFPLLLLLPLVMAKRVRSALIAVLIVVGLNAGGLLLPGVSPNGAVNALTDASGTWVGLASNGSLVKLLVDLGMAQLSAQVLAIGLVAACCVLILWYRREEGLRDPMPWLVLGLLAIPLSWTSYDVVFLGAVGMLTLSDVRPKRLVGLALWALWIIPIVTHETGYIGLGIGTVAVRLTLLTAWFGYWFVWHGNQQLPTWALDSAKGLPPEEEDPASKSLDYPTRG